MGHSWLRNLLIGLASLALCASFLSRPVHSQNTPVAVGQGGAVASVDSRATAIGIEVLKAGGNAVDAAVATAAALGVVEPFSAGIGGGGFMVIYQHDQNQIVTLDGREEAPMAVTADLFKDPDDPAGGDLPYVPNRISSGLAVGVPGTVLNWQTALSRYGTLSFAAALAPAIDLATTGFTVDRTFNQQIALNQARFSAFESTRQLYLPDGAPPAVGSHFRNPDLAATYQRLATQGVNDFYRGQLARAIATTVQHPPTVENPPFKVWPGAMTLADLDRYEVRVRSPQASTYRDYQIYGMGLPSSGGITVAQTLALLAEQDLSALDRADAIHHLIEAERLAFADRNRYLGDPEYVDVPLSGLLNDDYVSTRRALLPASAPDPEFRAPAGNPLPYQQDPSPSLTQVPSVAISTDLEGVSTTHLTTADRWGNVVSYTLTIESTGGSGIVVPGHGFLLNNELTDFDTAIPHPNVPEPGKRPRSSMAPTIAFAPDGRVLAFGSPGGSTIIPTVLGIMTNMVDFGLDLPGAIAAPRLAQRNSGVTLVEADFAASDVALALAQNGHQFQTTAEIGAATGIAIEPNGTIQAVAEPWRRGGGSARVVNP
ncbi:MAG: gamma-glutamyltransferase [Leptolyngbya sp. RL_3_1]|nr:gamma-glutamyltransferase [Leptolyngbya sp. RL_3_1]